MLDAVRTHWRDLVDGFWFVPGAVCAGFLALAILMLGLDRSGLVPETVVEFRGGAGAARDVLKTIAGSLITVAGITFSVTIVTLQLVSSQFTPRVIRTFLGDRITQIVLGTFVGIFIYSLVLLRAVRDENDAGEGGFVPGLGVALGILLAVLALGLFVVFIHHTAVSIQVSTIAARVARETLRSTDRLYPNPYGAEEEAGEAKRLLDEWAQAPSAAVCPSRPGFVQQISLDEIVERLPEEADRLHVATRPGDFVTEESVLCRIWPAGSVDDELRDEIAGLVYVADERSVAQDVGFGLRQLADIALRAVSPSVNDPTTALTCIGYLTSVLERLAGREPPLRVRRWDDRAVVAVADRVELAEHLDVLREIGRVTREDSRVTAALLRSVGRVARAAGPGRAGGLAELSAALARPALAAMGSDADRAEVERELERLPGELRSAAR